MKVLQVLPSLNSGGVERGTLDFARILAAGDHESLVMSSGGRLVAQLEREGSEHITFPVHAKSPASLWRVRALRRELLRLAPEVIHVRSRVPAWMVWLALRPLPPARRPLLVSTFHGLYSVSRYSAIMGRGDRVIAISECVRDYILANYPEVPTERIRVIHRGVDTDQFRHREELGRGQWLRDFERDYPRAAGRTALLMPGRLSPWKGQADFIDLVAELVAAGRDCHGLIAGEPTPGKDKYLGELRSQVARLGLEDHVTFLGHRSDMDHLYAHAAIVFNLSQKPEPFGRTVIEALAVGTPVVAWDIGGPAESLREALPAGLVPRDEPGALARRVTAMLDDPPREIALPAQFTLRAQAGATLEVYREGLATLGRTA